MRKKAIVLLLAGFLVLTACEKKEDVINEGSTPSKATPNDVEVNNSEDSTNQENQNDQEIPVYEILYEGDTVLVQSEYSYRIWEDYLFLRYFDQNKAELSEYIPISDDVVEITSIHLYKVSSAEGSELMTSEKFASSVLEDVDVEMADLYMVGEKYFVVSSGDLNPAIEPETGEVSDSKIVGGTDAGWYSECFIYNISEDSYVSINELIQEGYYIQDYQISLDKNHMYVNTYKAYDTVGEEYLVNLDTLEVKELSEITGSNEKSDGALWDIDGNLILLSYSDDGLQVDKHNFTEGSRDTVSLDWDNMERVYKCEDGLLLDRDSKSYFLRFDTLEVIELDFSINALVQCQGMQKYIIYSAEDALIVLDLASLEIITYKPGAAVSGRIIGWYDESYIITVETAEKTNYDEFKKVYLNEEDIVKREPV